MRERELQVVDVEVEAGEDNTDGWVEGGAVGDGLEVGGCDVTAEGGVGAAAEGEGFGG